MNNAVLYGNKDLNHWTRVSWLTHITPYLKSTDVLNMKYESILDDTFNESKRILDYIGIQRNDDYIENAIEEQSFNNLKKKFSEENKVVKANFLRKGKAQQWKKKLTTKENKVFVNLFGKDLKLLGYDLE